MYNVSNAYKAAIVKPNCHFELGGEIRLKSGDIVPITDSVVPLEEDVVIETRAMSRDSATDIGACATATLTMVLIDNNKTHLYADGEITLNCSLILENGEKETIPMGIFYIDGSKVERVKNLFSLIAYDGMVKLHYLLTDEMRAALKGKTAWGAAAYLYGAANMAQTESEVSEYPNADLALDFSSGQIETARDAIMWCGHLMGCFTRIDRVGKLEFVPLRPKQWRDNEENGTFTIIPERTLTPERRFYTKFSDKRMQIFALTMKDASKNPVTYRAQSTATIPTTSTLISHEIEQNPLVIGQSARSVYDVLKNIVLGWLARMVIQPFTSEIPNDPALEPGDYVTIANGGDNDYGSFSSMITHNVWRYRGRHKIISGASMQVVSIDEPVSAVRTLAAPTQTIASPEEKTYVQPRPQSEKAQNSGGAGISDRLEFKNQWTGAIYQMLLSFNGLEFYDGNNKWLGALRGFLTGGDLQAYTQDFYVDISKNSLLLAASTQSNGSYDKELLRITESSFTFFGHTIRASDL